MSDWQCKYAPERVVRSVFYITVSTTQKLSVSEKSEIASSLSSFVSSLLLSLMTYCTFRRPTRAGLDAASASTAWMTCLDVKALVFLLSGETAILRTFTAGFSFSGDITDSGGLGGGDNEVFAPAFWSRLGAGLFTLTSSTWGSLTSSVWSWTVSQITWRNSCTHIQRIVS